MEANLGSKQASITVVVKEKQNCVGGEMPVVLGEAGPTAKFRLGERDFPEFTWRASLPQPWSLSATRVLTNDQESVLRVNHLFDDLSESR
jgi:hypothetical protein